MNKKYMDFVPQTAVKAKTAKSTTELEVEEILTITPEPKDTAAAAKAKKISSRMPVFGKKTAARIMGEGMVKSAEAPKSTTKKPAAKKPELTDEILQDAVKKAEKDDKTLNLPKARFVNTEKVTKRPLSKNVYQRKIETPEEKPTGPVTIISKPEKDSRVGMVVTIIITIILGAAAGTVAFLLLPK